MLRQASWQDCDDIETQRKPRGILASGEPNIGSRPNALLRTEADRIDSPGTGRPRLDLDDGDDILCGQ